MMRVEIYGFSYQRLREMASPRSWEDCKIVELAGCSNAKDVKNARRELLERCRRVRHVLGTCGFVVTDCFGGLPEGFREVTPRGLREIVGFGVEGFRYRYGLDVVSSSPLGILRAGPLEKRGDSCVWIALLYSREDDLRAFKEYLDRFVKASASRGYRLSIRRQGGGWLIGDPLCIYMEPYKVSSVEELRHYSFDNDSFDADVLLHYGEIGQKLFGELKRNSIVERRTKCREKVSKLQIVDTSRIGNLWGSEEVIYYGTNLFHALFFKAGLLPYRLEVGDYGVLDNLSNAVFIGVALKRTSRGYVRALAGLVTGNYSAVLVTRGHMLGESRSMEMGSEEISNLVEEVDKSVRRVMSDCGVKPRLIVLGRTRRFNDRELDALGRAIDYQLLGRLSGGNARVIVTGFSKTKFRCGDSGSAYLLNGAKSDVALYCARRSLNFVRLEFAGWNFEGDELVRYALLSYEFSRRLNVWNPLPTYSTVPASLSLARRYLAWEDE